MMTPIELVSRWRGSITLVTLATWRSRKQGPSYIKIGGRVLYPEEAVDAWEKRRTMLKAWLPFLLVGIGV